MAPRPALVLFDLDGVLADYDRGARCDALASTTGASVAAVHEALFGERGLELVSDRGEIGLRSYLARLRARHRLRIQAGDFLAARRLATRVDARMLGLCERLDGQATLAIFSNNGCWVERHAADIVPALASPFAGRIVCSGSLRRLKPDPAAYAACLARLGFDAASAMFVDDRQDNVDGARAAGLDALRFEGVDKLRDALAARGFDPGDGDAI
jgi:putative hydrolase of the HAD superfamily